MNISNIVFAGGVALSIGILIRNLLRVYWNKHPLSDSTINNLFYSLALFSSSVRNTFDKIYKLNIYQERNLKIKVMLEFLKWFFISVGVFLFVLTYTGEVFFAFLYVPIMVVILKDKMRDVVNKEYLKFTKHLPVYLTNLRKEYLACRDVSRALEDLKPNAYLYRYSRDLVSISKHDYVGDMLYGKLLDKGFFLNSIIYNIVYKVSILGGSLEKYKITETPFPTCLSAIIAQVRKEHNIAALRKSQISSLKIITLISPIAFLFINDQVNTAFTMITHMYYGVYGTITKMLYVIAFCIIYTMFSMESDLFKVLANDKNEIIDAIYGKIKFFIDVIKPKNDNKFKVRMTLANSYQTEESFTTRRVVYSVLFYIVFSVVVTAALYFSRVGIRESMSSFGLAGNSGYKEEYKEFYQDTDNNFIDMPDEQFNQYNRESLAQVYMSSIPRLTQYSSLINADRIINKRKAYYSAVLPNWFMFVFLLVAVVGWFTPDILLWYRRKIFLEVRERDITLIMHHLIMFSFTTESAYNVLSLLARSCSVLSTEIFFIRELSSTNVNQLLERQRYIGDDLAQIYSAIYYVSSKLSPEEAFSDMYETTKDRMVNEMEEETEQINNKRSAFLMISLLPLFLIIFLVLVYPMMVSSMSALMDTFDQMNQVGS